MDLIQKFITPIWVTIIKDSERINDELIQFIYELKEKDIEGSNRSNILGWHSPDFNLKNNNEPKKLLDILSPHLNSVIRNLNWNMENKNLKITSMWAIVNKKYAANHQHIHANNLLSAVYYVQASKNSGDIFFSDPRPGAKIKVPKLKQGNDLSSMNYYITPQSGMFVVFPSWLEHSVGPNMTDKERIIISFNADIENSK